MISRSNSLLRYLKMKLSTFVFGAFVAAREWQQPKYFDALEMMNQRKGGWGAPIGREAADHSLCANITAPEHGTIECDGATCALKCDLGAIANGRRRTKCRFNEKIGHFWKKELGTCHTCEEDPVAPEFVNTSCFFDKRGRRQCNLFCEWNQDLILNGDALRHNRFKTTCRCPRPNKRECSWKGQDKIANLTCIDRPTTTWGPITGTGLPFTGLEGV